jgi:hypothetical protein
MVFLSGLLGHGFLIASRTFEQQFLGIEDAILSHMTGHDRLGLVA